MTASRITEAMLRDWQARGVTVAEAAEQIGVTRHAIMEREHRVGITLLRTRTKAWRMRQADMEPEAASNTRVKAWSCSPAAIQRALEQRGMQ